MVLSHRKKIEGIYCCAYSCRNKPVAKKAGLCHKHYARRIKERDKVYDRYANFKRNALRRGKEFTITLDEFRFFCQRTGYIINKGYRGMNATIDRRCNIHGYHIWNIQILTLSQNSRKGSKFAHEREDLPF